MTLIYFSLRFIKLFLSDRAKNAIAKAKTGMDPMQSGLQKQILQIISAGVKIKT